MPGNGDKAIEMVISYTGKDPSGIECAFFGQEGMSGAEALADLVARVPGRWYVQGELLD
jgi:hypothetical protein